MGEIKAKYLPDLVLQVSEQNPKEIFKELVEMIKPEWDWDTVQTKTLQGGFVNNLTHVYLPSEPANNGLVFRLFGGFGGVDLGGLVDRTKEIIGIQAAYKAGCGAPVYAIFKNGIVMGFLQGRNLTIQDFLNPKIHRQYAKAIASIHCLEPKSLTAPNGDPSPFDPKKDIENFYTGMKDIMLSIPETMPKPEDDERVKANLPPREEIQKEFNFSMEFLKSLDLPITFCHGDAHFRNTIYNEEENKVYLVDFEMIGYNYQFTDVAANISSAHVWNFLEADTDPDVQAQATNDEFVISFIRCYLEEKAKLERKPASTVTEDEVTEMKMILDITHITDSVIGMACGPMFELGDKKGLDGIGMAIYGKEQYFAGKEKMLELGKQYLERKKK